MGKELDSTFYDNSYSDPSRGYDGAPEELKYYYPNWKSALDYIYSNNYSKIVDLGCGPGHFAQMICEDRLIDYIGYDFSEIAIQKAISCNNNKNNKFEIKNLKEFIMPTDNCIFTAFEFLEHVSFDVDIIKKLHSGDEIIFSVPNYDSAGHVRVYPNEDYVNQRYGEFLSLTRLNIVEWEIGKIFLYLGVRV